MTLDPSVWVFAFAWFMAGLINGLSGMGAAMLALPIAAMAMPPKLLIPATCLMVLVVSVSTAVFYLKNIRRRAFLALLLGAIPGSLAGLGILLFTPVPFLQISAGAIMVLYTIWQFCHPSFAPHGDSWLSGSIAGFASGLVNTSISFGNPPVAIYSLWAGWSKEDTMGTMNVFTICATILTCTAHASAGLYSMALLPYALVGIPATVIGVCVAHPIAKRIPQESFQRILLVIIAAAGVVCTYQGLSRIIPQH